MQSADLHIGYKSHFDCESILVQALNKFTFFRIRATSHAVAGAATARTAHPRRATSYYRRTGDNDINDDGNDDGQ